MLLCLNISTLFMGNYVESTVQWYIGFHVFFYWYYLFISYLLFNNGQLLFHKINQSRGCTNNGLRYVIKHQKVRNKSVSK